MSIEDEYEEAEYENIDKIGFDIKIDSNVDEVFSKYGKDGIRYATQTCSKVSFSIESAGIRFPISEESGKAIVEKWIYLKERKSKKMGIDNEMGICVYCDKEVYSRVGSRVIRNAICEECIRKLEQRAIQYD